MTKLAAEAAAALSDQELLYQATRYDNLRGEDEIMDSDQVKLADALDDEIVRRWGVDASDNLASYFTASHADPDDRIWWTQNNPDVLVEIAQGTHQHVRKFSLDACVCGARNW